MGLIKSRYNEDCIFLLKDISNEIKEITIMEKEEVIRSGVSYSEVISKENIPSYEIRKIFLKMLERESKEIAIYISKISEIIYKEKGDNLIIVSLARAGTPIGVLIKKYIKFKYNIDIPHYSVSIIRGIGIDENAIKYILKSNENANIQFVDGWTGKGSITKELNKSILKFNKEYNMNIDDSLAVLADPAKLCRIYGTREDYGIPTSCLNSTVSGLISRTIYNKKYIKENDFHGAKYLDYLEKYDFSKNFIDEISSEFKIKEFNLNDLKCEDIDKNYANTIAREIKEAYKVRNINNIKLSVGESARVLLRRDPRAILVRNLNDKNVEHIIKLAKEKEINIIENKDLDYNCISIIKE